MELRFERRAALRKWFAANHNRPKGLWLVFEKGKTAQTITADEALEEALCHGWIDGQLRRIDERVYHKWFAPRRGRSHWSEKNKATVARLLAAGKMAAPGLEAMETAKANGSWAAKQVAPITKDHIAALEQALGDGQVALENYRGMSPSVRKIYAALYADAKQEETRIRRLAKIVDRLNRNLKPM
jgi:uncharacterized protein YdeI (YjbR/CyaY-like superfamily)